MSTSKPISTQNPFFDEELVAEAVEVLPEEQDKDSVAEDVAVAAAVEPKEEYKPMCFGLISVNQEVKAVNLIMLAVATFYLGFTFMFLFNFQTFFLLNKQGNSFSDFDKPVQRMDTTQQIWSLIAALVWGYFSDKYGRKLIISLGFVQMALALFFIPTTTDIMPGYMITYLLFAQGYTAVFVAMLGQIFDYFQTKSIAQALSMYFTAYSIGTLLGGTTYTFSAPEALCINNMYHVAASFSLVTAILCFVLLKNTQQFPHENGYICSAFRKGFVKSWQNKLLLLAFLGGVVAFAANIVPRFFIVGWMHRDFHDRGACRTICVPIGGNVCPPRPNYERTSVCEEDTRDFNRVGCPNGHVRMMDLMRVVAPMQIATSILFFLAEKLNAKITLLLTTVFIAITFGLVTKIQDYNLSESNAMVLNYFWSIGGVLGLLSAVNLLLQEVTRAQVGILCGMFFAFMQIGALLSHGLGGYLFGVKTIGAPFLVVMWLAIVSSVATAIYLVYQRIKLN